MVTLEELRGLAANAASMAGDPLEPLDRQFIRLGVAASVTSLNSDAIKAALTEVYAAGGTPGQAQEILSLVSGLGVHSLMAASLVLLEQAREAGLGLSEELKAEHQLLWDEHVGGDPFWAGFERELPGFLRSMLILSSDQFVAFFSYCAVPWKTRRVRAKIKELTAMACDATPAHRFLPGFRLHLANAVTLGAGTLALDAALDIAAHAPEHVGTR